MSQTSSPHRAEVFSARACLGLVNRKAVDASEEDKDNARRDLAAATSRHMSPRRWLRHHLYRLPSARASSRYCAQAVTHDHHQPNPAVSQQDRYVSKISACPTSRTWGGHRCCCTTTSGRRRESPETGGPPRRHHHPDGHFPVRPSPRSYCASYALPAYEQRTLDYALPTSHIDRLLFGFPGKPHAGIVDGAFVSIAMSAQLRDGRRPSSR